MTVVLQTLLLPIYIQRFLQSSANSDNVLLPHARCHISKVFYANSHEIIALELSNIESKSIRIIGKDTKDSIINAILIIQQVNTSPTANDSLFTSLHRLLDFMIDDISNINTDALFAVSIAKQVLNEHLSEGLTQLIYKCELILNEGQNVVKRIEPHYFKQFEQLIVDPHFVRVLRKRLSLSSEFCTNNYSKSSSYINENNPDNQLDEELSDMCILHVLKYSNHTEQCKQIMLNGWISAAGYKLTHQLLYHQITIYVSDRVNESERRIVESICCKQILMEMNKQLSKRVIECEDRDLVIEQALLCGINGGPGSNSFLDERLLSFLIEWQHISGCYIGNHDVCKDELTRSTRVSRESRTMKYNCSSHITGLSAGLYALFLVK
ncbi:hypothetical protein GJ496_000723 [Pomphorhynchus laevis]|nr:hypothetical protein GJ496_000723 [Pomphorhynchus laevis]